MVRSRLIPLSLLIGTLFLAGCVHYVPVRLDAAPPNDELRVDLTNEGAVQVVRSLGRIQERLDGTVRLEGSDSVRVSVWIGKDYRGTPFENVRVPVMLGRDEVVAVKRRQISVPRTALLAVGVVGGFGYLVDRIVFHGNPNPDEGNGNIPPPALDLITLWRILWTGIH